MGVARSVGVVNKVGVARKVGPCERMGQADTVMPILEDLGDTLIQETSVTLTPFYNFY